MEEAQLVVNRLLEKEPKTRQEIQLIKLEVAREWKFASIPPNNQLLAKIDAKKEPELEKVLDDSKPITLDFITNPDKE